MKQHIALPLLPYSFHSPVGVGLSLLRCAGGGSSVVPVSFAARCCARQAVALPISQLQHNTLACRGLCRLRYAVGLSLQR